MSGLQEKEVIYLIICSWLRGQRWEALWGSSTGDLGQEGLSSDGGRRGSMATLLSFLD